MNRWSHPTLTVSLELVGLGPTGRVGASRPVLACDPKPDWLHECLLSDLSARGLDGWSLSRPTSVTLSKGCPPSEGA